MENDLVHDIELYPSDSFKTLLEHEVHRSRRYQHPLTLLHIRLETDPDDRETVHKAEVFAINILNIRLRETDIPSKQGSEFLVLMPATDEQGGRMACERLEELFNAVPKEDDKVSFRLVAFMGMATLPGDRSISSSQLLQNAAQALQQAQTNRLTRTVVFSPR